MPEPLLHVDGSRRWIIHQNGLVQHLPHLPPQWRRSPRSAPVVAVLLVHALLLLVWVSGVAPRLRGPAALHAKAPLNVRNVALLPPAPQSIEPLQQALPSERPRQPAAPMRPRPASVLPTSTPPADAVPSTTTSMPARATQIVTITENAASAPLQLTLPSSPRGTAMQGRGALTEAQGSVRQLALNDPRSNQHADPTQKLPEAVAAAGKGDCLKGEYFTPAQGLLAAPFLAYAVAAGHCKPQR